MPATPPDPLAFGGNPDPGQNTPPPPPGNPPYRITAPKRRPLQGVWTAADGGPGPAEWRKHKGNIKGLARRKGEPNPFKWGFEVDDSVLGHPALQNSRTLPPRKKPPKKPKEAGENKKGPGFLGKLFGRKGK